MRTSEERKRAGRPTRPYRLYCYAPMPRTHDASAECEACGEQNLRIDQDIYRTRESWLRRVESGCKALIALFISWITYSLLFSFDGGFGIGQGMAIGAPLLLIGLFGLFGLTEAVESWSKSDALGGVALVVPPMLAAGVVLLGSSLAEMLFGRRYRVRP